MNRKRYLIVAAALAFPLAVAGIYLGVGTPAALSPQKAAAKDGANPHAISSEQLNAMVGRLAERMRTTPEDTDGWIMLARSYAALGRYSESSAAYEQAVQRLPNDSRLLADYADVAAMAQGRRLQGKPETLIERALAADPRNAKALSLSGTVAFEKGDYAGAIAHWRKILALVPAGSDAERSVRASIADAERRGNIATVGIDGRVELERSLAGQVNPDDTVFIFARVPGERMPLAMLRRRAAELPLAFRLDDNAAMSPTAKLSDAKEVVIVARLSRSGQAQAQPGDFEGSSARTRPGATGVVVKIKAENRAEK
ncbi:MAG TPA: tetratricopeptide repeat protein [Burkholderiales bacterium]|nr:tetratricopeptide repeat protein [Burkholderiales bacterium]